MNYTKLRKTPGLSALVSVCLFLAASVVPASRSLAQSAGASDTLQTYYNATSVAGVAKGGAGNVKAVNLKYMGRSQAGVTATSTGAYVTISATAMTFYHPFGTVDTSVGTAGVITYASTLASNTMGALCDYLNNLGLSYQCSLMGAQRNDPPVILTTQTETDGTNNLQAVGGFSATQSTTTFVSLGITPGANRRVVLKQCITKGESGANDQGFAVYGELRKFGAIASPNAVDTFGVAANDSYSVYVASPAAATATTIPTLVLPYWLEFSQGAHVVVRQGNTASLTVQTAADTISCYWDER